MNIFDCAAQYASIMMEVEENEGIFTEEQAELLKATEDTVEVKVKAYAGIMKSNKGKIEVLEEEIKRLQSRKKALENSNERLKEFTKFAIDTFGFEDPKNGNKKLKYVDATFWIQGKEVLDFDDEAVERYIDRVRMEIDRGNKLNFEYIKDSLSFSIGNVEYENVTDIVNDYDGILLSDINISVKKTPIFDAIKGLKEENYPKGVPEGVKTKITTYPMFR